MARLAVAVIDPTSVAIPPHVVEPMAEEEMITVNVVLKDITVAAPLHPLIPSRKNGSSTIKLSQLAISRS